MLVELGQREVRALRARAAVSSLDRQQQRALTAQLALGARRDTCEAQLIACVLLRLGLAKAARDLAQDRGQRDQVAAVVLDDRRERAAGDLAAQKAEVGLWDQRASDVVDAC